MESRSTRFSGDIEIGIIYSERERQYACRLSMPGEQSVFQVVGEPAVLEVAVDAPEAFDMVAHAALSFADEERRWSIEDHAALSDDGWHIGRTKEERWPCS
jgi:hypothetical protein